MVMDNNYKQALRPGGHMILTLPRITFGLIELKAFDESSNSMA